MSECRRPHNTNVQADCYKVNTLMSASQAEEEDTASHPDVPSCPLLAEGNLFPLFFMVFLPKCVSLNTCHRLFGFTRFGACFCFLLHFVLKNFRLVEKLFGMMNTNIPFT